MSAKERLTRKFWQINILIAIIAFLAWCAPSKPHHIEKGVYLTITNHAK